MAKPALCDGQISIYEYDCSLMTEPDVGELVEDHGAVICHIMRPAYIGKKVVIDKSTVSHKWFMCGILEQYIPYENGLMRSIVFTGHKQRSLITHYPGIEIYEPLPWDAYRRCRP